MSEMNCNCNAMCPEAQRLLRQIEECEFTLIDINLFLDTHYGDERALADYNCYAQQLRVLKDKFVEQYGPIENFGNSTSEGSWKWRYQEWPWDRMRTEG